METRKRESRALREALRAAYRRREEADVGDGWRPGVMERIRRTKPAKAAPGFWESLGVMVWRLAPVTCLLIVALGAVFLFSMDVGQPFDVFDVFLRKWEEQTLTELTGFRGWS
jgi:hypothetical protein